MRMSKVNTALIVLIAVLTLGFNCYAQPSIPKDKIPSNLSPEVKAAVEGLYNRWNELSLELLGQSS